MPMLCRIYIGIYAVRPYLRRYSSYRFVATYPYLPALVLFAFSRHCPLPARCYLNPEDIIVLRPSPEHLILSNSSRIFLYFSSTISHARTLSLLIFTRLFCWSCSINVYYSSRVVLIQCIAQRRTISRASRPIVHTRG